MSDFIDLGADSPLSALSGPGVSGLATEKGVRFMLVAGKVDRGAWGLVGAFWLSADAERGGFIVNPDALWRGSDLARSYRSALHRGWVPEQIYRYWQRRMGPSGEVMIDPEQQADTLLYVYRRVGAL